MKFASRSSGLFYFEYDEFIKENVKLARMMCTTLTSRAMKDTLKKLFSDISSMKYKTVPAIKE